MEPGELIERIESLHGKAAQYRTWAHEATERRNELMRQAYRAGVTMAELARLCGMSREAVSQALGRPTGRTWTNTRPETTKAPDH
jgi:hypothetical protein